MAGDVGAVARGGAGAGKARLRTICPVSEPNSYSLVTEGWLAQRLKLTRNRSLTFEYGVGGGKGGSIENDGGEMHLVGVGETGENRLGLVGGKLIPKVDEREERNIR